MKRIFVTLFAFLTLSLLMTANVFAGEQGEKKNVSSQKKQKSVEDSKQVPKKTVKQKKSKKSEKKSPTKLYFSNFQIGGGFEVGAPLHFKDTPDQTVDTTLALLYGARLAFLFGHYSNDDHRFGLAVNFDVAAKSSDRTLMYVTPYLIYNIGYPFTLETGLGYAISLGTKNFAENYDGLFTQVAVKYTFNSAKKHAPVGVSLGITGKFILPFDDLTYISAFAGVSLEIMYRSNKLQ